MISTTREDLKGAYGLNELHRFVIEDRLEYRGRPQLWNVGRTEVTDGTPRSSPVQVYSTGNWTSGELGIYSTSQALFLLDNRGKLSTYGWNSNSWLGLSGIVGNELNGTWAKVKPGGWRFCFGLLSDDSVYPFRPNGILKGWGYNNYGQLGQGDTVERSSPTQVPGNWKDFFPYYNANDYVTGESSQAVSPNMFALTVDDQLWAWGANNQYGILALGDGANRSSPVQVPSPSGRWRNFQRMSLWAGGISDMVISICGVIMVMVSWEWVILHLVLQQTAPLAPLVNRDGEILLTAMLCKTPSVLDRMAVSGHGVTMVMVS